jgi:predicted transcriptional regulator
MAKKTTVIRLEPEDLEVLKQIAKNTNRSVSNVIQLAVKQFIQSEREKSRG